MPFPKGDVLLQRDPNEINEHLKVAFEDVLGEPESTHSNDCVWQLSYRCFGVSKICCYRMLACFTGCFLSLFWGWWFAVLTFCQVWCCTPCLRGFAINMGCLQKMHGICVQCYYAPIYETCALCCTKIFISQTIKKQGFYDSTTPPSEKERSFVTPF